VDDWGNGSDTAGFDRQDFDTSPGSSSAANLAMGRLLACLCGLREYTRGRTLTLRGGGGVNMRNDRGGEKGRKFIQENFRFSHRTYILFHPYSCPGGLARESIAEGPVGAPRRPHSLPEGRILEEPWERNRVKRADHKPFPFVLAHFVS